MSASPTAHPLVVLDTNVVLDCLLFHNSECKSLWRALRAGELYWVGTAAMRDELAHVLGRGDLDSWHPNLPEIWSNWDRHCVEMPVPPPAAAMGQLRCTDPDDQKFIDLAVSCRARWLLSRDRAVLRLARRLRDVGVQAQPPGVWSPA
jgi:predicted nucleic acid-binding protein